MTLPRRIFLPAAVSLIAVCLVSFGLTVEDVLRRTAKPPVTVAFDRVPDAHPRVIAFRSGHDAQSTGLALGDRILAVGDSDLRGAGYIRWQTAFAQHQGADVEVPVSFRRGSVEGDTVVRPTSAARYWPRLPASLAFLACAVFLLMRMRPSPLVRSLVYANLAAAAVLLCIFDGGVFETVASAVVHLGGAAVALPMALRSFLLLPDGLERSGRWARYGPWAFVLIVPFDASVHYGGPFSAEVGTAGTSVVLSIYAAIMVWTLASAYRSAEAVGRRKLKWVVLGHYLGMAPAAAAVLAATMNPGAYPLVAIAVSAIGVIPVAMLIAITSYNFLDVDGVMSSAASMTFIAAIGGFIVLVLMPPASEVLAPAMGLHRSTASFLVGAAFFFVGIPFYRLVRPRFEGWLFAERRLVESGMAALVQTLSSAQSPEELTKSAADGIERLFHPRSITFYTRSDEVFVPVSVRGDSAPASFSIKSPVIAALEGQPGLLTLGEEESSLLGRANLSLFQKAVLESLGVPLVAPIRRDGNLVAFFCLGERLSGDVYSPSDVALLGLVADKLSSALHSFDQADLIRASRQLQERLRRYVPEALAEQLEEHRDLDIGLAEVSVLFVDIRGYSQLAEHLLPDEIFATINRYTELVSSCVREQDGTVVEFNGDGMMAVFGAPRALDAKEAAAVSAGRLILDRLASASDSEQAIPVGIGIATGSAFVGNVQAVDRLIWTALGNTTNLASRLQSMTREFDTPMIIDEPTWREAGAARSGFLHHGPVQIRGVMRAPVLYVLPPPEPTAF